MQTRSPMSISTLFQEEIQFPEVSFENLMQKRIYQVLIICSNYDFFQLEVDGRIDEQIFNEYVSLNLRYPPVFLQADSAEKAFEILENSPIDLVINMLSISGIDPFELANRIKAKHSRVPIVVLTPFSREVRQKLQREDLSSIDYVFSWLGDASILLAVIKLLEDKMNLENDVKKEGVQALLLVEDSVRFYSSYLPHLYKFVLKQSQEFMKEGLNEYRGMMRMRGRPKIMLATTYEDALELYNAYHEKLLGVISDVKYPRNGVKDPEAGLQLCQEVRKDDAYLPFVFQSSDLDANKDITDCNTVFLYKNSKNLSFELKNYIFKNLAFGDFVFRDPDTLEELARAHNLQEVQRKIHHVPMRSLRYHFQRNDFSRWLNARALFPIAKKLKYVSLDEFSSVEEARDFILRIIAQFRISQSRGVIASFDRDTYDEYLLFSRIGEGSLGGKARGLAFIESFLNRSSIWNKYKDVHITIPRTVVITTELFDEFMETNQLYQIALSDASDEEILQAFVKAALPLRLKYDLAAFLHIISRPLAVRSSSVLEDSHYQPFAGIYSTYMVAHQEDKQAMQEQVEVAVKSVYASVYFASSKAYMEATSNMIDEEKMSIIIQEICGSRYGDYFYPNISGIARSINFYPIEPEQPQDGIAKVALGLGKTIVEGWKSLRFSPKYPEKALQLSSPEAALRETQKQFYALELDPAKFRPSTDDSINLSRLRVRDAEKHRSLKHLASTFDLHNNVLRDGTNYEGKKLITFSNVLKHKVFPLADIIKDLLDMGQNELNNPVEIEFAVNLDRPKDEPCIFNFLQIRPIVDTLESEHIEINNPDFNELLIYSESALGNGLIEDIYDLVYVIPEHFDPAKTHEIAGYVSEMNTKLRNEGRNYALIGPGRWGSSDPWLGIPVKWVDISNARLIVESGLSNYRIDPSQGTHFFQNLTSFRVGYFTVNPYEQHGFYNTDYLKQTEAEEENYYLRHIRFEQPVMIKIDGKNNQGAVFKPGYVSKEEKPAVNFGMNHESSEK